MEKKRKKKVIDEAISLLRSDLNEFGKIVEKLPPEAVQRIAIMCLRQARPNAIFAGNNLDRNKKITLLGLALEWAAKNRQELNTVTPLASRSEIAIYCAAVIEQLGHVITVHPPVVINALSGLSFAGHATSDAECKEIFKALEAMEAFKVKK